MTIDLIDSEQRIVLDNISWDLYERLLTAHRDRRVPRFTYDRGCLEIVSPSAEHERITERIALLVNLVAEVKGINVAGYGSTTFRREDLAKGLSRTHVSMARTSTAFRERPHSICESIRRRIL